MSDNSVGAAVLRTRRPYNKVRTYYIAGAFDEKDKFHKISVPAGNSASGRSISNFNIH